MVQSAHKPKRPAVLGSVLQGVIGLVVSPDRLVQLIERNCLLIRRIALQWLRFCTDFLKE